MDGSHRPQYQLRRVGKPASIVGVKDVMRLNADVTRFGRHSHNDYYLDSSQLAHFISRWHSEIHRVEQEGRIKYIIRDNSLNGTYVNDVRVSGNSVLQEGDIIIFGHTNGKNVKPGQRAIQADSEFKFQFEKVTAQLNDSIVNSSFQESSLHNGVGSSRGSPSIPLQGPIQNSTNGVVLKDISNTNCSTSTGLIPIDSIITQQAQSEDGGRDLHTSTGAEASDEDIFNSDESDDDDTNQSSSAITTGSTTILTTASAMRPVHTPPPPSKAELRGSSPTPKRGRPPKSSPKSKTQLLSKASAESATPASKKRKKPASAATPTSQTSSRTKEDKRPAPDSEGKKRKKAKGPLQKPTASGGRRSRRRKSEVSASSPSDSHSDSEYEESAEEDYTYHYDGDACEALDCTRPVSDKVSWVQCDDCDRWYHTCCVGCSFEMVAQDNTQFHCGCK